MRRKSCWAEAEALVSTRKSDAGGSSSKTETSLLSSMTCSLGKKKKKKGKMYWQGPDKGLPHGWTLPPLHARNRGL